ncbi:ImmA/IrrE family metallo-endopeptidase [Paraburkholderia sp. UCT2]|uniref:ImmA/IrrE family metallo-endopeptidase n=1 Tax=Paraburkholderia sp. UCT2 TaxID=2615208 RepID=UPI00165676D1|nr:ImmA/IrrE family metallo-endopeptidase [Paraburkholderia sp. UCT2]MBC8729964.1 ImmA/IrrE family metallo-endopeptidase [Paraburkholderia sp. UCT2]
MAEAEHLPYEIRGNRVARISVEEVEQRAKRFCKLFGVTKKTRHNFAAFIEFLSTRNICVDPIDDSEWLWVTDAICSPETFTILVPLSLYLKACSGNEMAISTLCHEIGHLVLAHKAVLHNAKSAKPSKEEDAEWQADMFADYVAARMGISLSRQLRLDFDGLK